MWIQGQITGETKLQPQQIRKARNSKNSPRYTNKKKSVHAFTSPLIFNHKSFRTLKEASPNVSKNLVGVVKLDIVYRHSERKSPYTGKCRLDTSKKRGCWRDSHRKTVPGLEFQPLLPFQFLLMSPWEGLQSLGPYHPGQVPGP